MPDHPALLPCPCCGSIFADRRLPGERSVAPLLEEIWMEEQGWRVRCTLCGIRTGVHPTAADAVLTWHRRPGPPETVEEERGRVQERLNVLMADNTPEET